MTVTELTFDEPAGMDEHRIAALFRTLGAGEADETLSDGVEDLLKRVCAMQQAHDRGDLTRLGHLAARVTDVAEPLGLAGCATVAGDVARTVRAADRTAIAATLARLHRQCDRAIMTLWALDETGA